MNIHNNKLNKYKIIKKKMGKRYRDGDRLHAGVFNKLLNDVENLEYDVDELKKKKDNNTWRPIKVNNKDILGKEITTPLNLLSGDGVTIEYDNNGNVTITSTGGGGGTSYIAGNNIEINGNVISAVDTTYAASDFDIKDLSDTTGLRGAWSNKQDTIDDLDTIRNGATLGATALQSFIETDPTVPDWAKTPNKPTYTAQEVGALPSSTTIPTKTSELINDSGYITGYTLPIASTSGLGGVKIGNGLEIDSTGVVNVVGKQDVLTAGNNIEITSAGTISATNTTYVASDFDIKDLSDTTGLRGAWSNKQDTIDDLDTIRNGATLGATALQSFIETDPTVPDWAKTPNKPTYTAQEVGALPSSTTIPTKTSELINDSGYITGYTLPIASTSGLGGVKIGNGLEIDSTGVVNVVGKQDVLTAGNNIEITSAGTISATNTTYVASDFDVKDLADTTGLREEWSNKQNPIYVSVDDVINFLNDDAI